jgi:glycosyltransferase involved in cell wall biosynthesis/O-antigen/teichoic acid export membrane protein
MFEQALATARQGEGSRDSGSAHLHVLILTDRDWTHPQGGGTGTHLYGHVSRWLGQGHRVTVVAGSYPGAIETERIDNLTIYRMGGRISVFPRAIWKLRRGLVPDADVALEVINGISFVTPLWLRLPRVSLIHHIHRAHYADELGLRGRIAAFMLETLPLRLLYRRSRFVTVSRSSAAAIAAHGIPINQIAVSYNGVESEAFGPGVRAEEPTLIYLGRLKRYKRIEALLDVLESIPAATLDIVGAGGHRRTLEAEVDERGLRERVRFHGHVDEPIKVALLQRAWVHVTASPREGWGLNVMEAAACGTASVGVAEGGLKESILHAQTGMLAKDTDELAMMTKRVIDDHELRDLLGKAALERAKGLTWDRSAATTLDVLATAHSEAAVAAAPQPDEGWATERARASGMAAAVVGANVVALLFTLVFARALGSAGYASLVSLVSAFLILSMPASAIQIAIARAVGSAHRSDGREPRPPVIRWLRDSALVALAIAVLAIPLRHEVASALGVHAVWAAASLLPTGCLWFVLSVERGALQGLQRYRWVGWSLVGEAAARFAFGLLLYACGLGVTGVFLGSGLSILLTTIVLGVALRRTAAGWPADERESGFLRLRDLLAGTAAPVATLALLAVLQNSDVIVVARHSGDSASASSYAAAAVAAKGIVWLVVGLGLYLLPEVARSGESGSDTRPLVKRVLALMGLVAAPILALYAGAPHPVLRAVFGSNLAGASGALPLLALAMLLLAASYLAIQYLIAMHHWTFIWALAFAAVLEPTVLLGINSSPTSIALALAAVQLVVAAGLVRLGVRSWSRAHADAPAVA